MTAANAAINKSATRKILAFVPASNTRHRGGKLLRDATGAFQPEAATFLKTMGTSDSRIVRVDNTGSMTMRRREVVDELEAVGGCAREGIDPGVDCVAFFCHGWSRGIQLGFTTALAKPLAKLIWESCGHNAEVVVVLYCCSTGGDRDTKRNSPGTGDGSFADKLRDELCTLGAVLCRVVAHTTVAHTTRNPFAIFMDGMGTPFGGAGGYFPVGQGSKLWGKWRKALQKGTLRFRFPFMTVADIHTEIAA